MARFRPEPSDDDVRDLALKRLKALLTGDPFASELGRSLLDKMGALASDEVVAQSFSDAFRAKAASTLCGHSCALARFSFWCARQGVEPLRATEEELYAYLCEMRSSKRGATSGDKFLRSLSFLEHVAGLLFMKMDEVRLLEELMCEDLQDTDACVLGQLLMCIHSAGRWRDIQGLHEVEVSVGPSTSLLIASGLKSKTTQTPEAQRRFLPYVAVATGVSGRNWGERWLEARTREGLTWGGDFCLPSFSLRLGRWSSVRMGSGEASAYLRDFLTAIGHHAASDTKSMLVYSREAYSRLYAKVVAMFRTITTGSFDPDLPPAERVEHMASTLLRNDPRPPVQSIESPPDGNASASSGESEAGELE
ncbi:unnamed protein product, partial [Symbiodinium sp. CCMP2456]